MDEDPDYTNEHDLLRRPIMGHTSRSSSASVLIAPRRGAYGLGAESAAREAEINRTAAALRRAERDAAPADRAEDDFIDARLAEIDERERELADREKLIATLEAHLDQSRCRLEERLAQLAERDAAQLRPAASLGALRPPPVATGDFGPGSYPNEADWWTRQLGRKPQLPATVTASAGKPERFESPPDRPRQHVGA